MKAAADDELRVQVRIDDLVNGSWLPVIGAGMSLNATLAPPAKMPLWGDLSKYFADELKDYSPNGVLDAISASRALDCLSDRK